MFARLRLDGLVGSDNEQNHIHPADTSQHVAYETLMPRNVDKSQSQDLPVCRSQIHMGKTQVNRNSAPLFFQQAIGVDPRQRLDQCGFAVIDMPSRTDDDRFHLPECLPERISHRGIVAPRATTFAAGGLAETSSAHYPPCMPTPATLGFNLHTGWAALVAIAGKPGKFEVLLRTRIELLPGDQSIPRFVYHKASELSLTEASDLVRRAKVAAGETARAAGKDAIKQLQSLGLAGQAAGI